jgi:hypothetical protein
MIIVEGANNTRRGEWFRAVLVLGIAERALCPAGPVLFWKVINHRNLAV